MIAQYAIALICYRIKLLSLLIKIHPEYISASLMYIQDKNFHHQHSDIVISNCCCWAPVGLTLWDQNDNETMTPQVGLYHACI